MYDYQSPYRLPVQPQYQPQMQQPQGFSVRPVASREEATAVQTDFFGPGILMPCLGQGVIYLKRFNSNTGASDLIEFVYAPPKPKNTDEFVNLDSFNQLLQRVSQLENKILSKNEQIGEINNE